MQRDDLGNRMKLYEDTTDNRLVNGVPVIIRIDGRSFHTFTKGMMKPFDEIFSLCMQQTMKYLCENIANCVFGYTQSDEITLILIDNKSGISHPWFDNRVEKIITASATMATLAFNKALYDLVNEIDLSSANKKLYENKVFMATFDARAFNVPKEDVVNNIIWRQADATKNSINALAHANLSFKEIQGKSCAQMQDMLMLEKGINWNDVPTRFKRGLACIRKTVNVETSHGLIERNRWVVDSEMPIISQNREYVENTLKGEC